MNHAGLIKRLYLVFKFYPAVNVFVFSSNIQGKLDQEARLAFPFGFPILKMEFQIHLQT